MVPMLWPRQASNYMNSTMEKMEPKQAELLMLTQIRKNLGHSHELQKLGYKISVQVNRLPAKVGEALHDTDRDSQTLKEMTIDSAMPYYQLRAARELAVQAETAIAPTERQSDVFEEMMRMNYIYPKGGYTKVEMTHPINGKTYTGECHFN